MSGKLAKTWRERTAALRGRLTPEQLEALRRARMGYPPATILGWHLARDPFEPSIAMIEGIARALAGCFPWPGPDDVPEARRQWVDFRHETTALTEFAVELREAIAADRIESAILRGMAIGTMFTRLAYLLLDGDVIASGSAVGRGRPKAQAQRKANAEDRWNEILPIVDRLERRIRPDVKGQKRWDLVAENYRVETGETLATAAAQKRLPVWRESSDNWPKPPTLTV